MAITTGNFTTDVKGAITNGRLTVTFDTPSDFADWLEKYRDVDLRTWQWVTP